MKETKFKAPPPSADAGPGARVRPPLADIDTVRVQLPDVAGVEGIAGVMEVSRLQLEREVGARFVREGGEGTFSISIADVDAPTATVDRARGTLSLEASALPGLFEAFDRIRDLWMPGVDTASSVDLHTDAEVGEAIATSVRTTWPALDRSAWDAACARYQHRVGEPGVAEAWVATLGDAHTGIRRQPVGRLPYDARLIDDAIVFTVVPEGTLAALAGLRPGAVLEDVDVSRICRTTGASPHSKAHVVGYRALQGPLSVARSLSARNPDGSRICWEETPGRMPWNALTAHSRHGNIGYLRIRQWLAPEVNEGIETALAALSGCRLLVVDLRGNTGGNGVSAMGFAGRFLRGSGGATVRWTLPDGQLTPHEPIPYPDAEPWPGEVRFLTDGLTYSASEDLLLPLARMPHVQVWGERSGGGSGRVRRVRLWPDVRLTVTSCHTFTAAGGRLEGRGIPVDREIRLDGDLGEALRP